MHTAQAQILRFWRAVELFSPQKVPRLEPNNRKSLVFRLNGQIPMPWDSLSTFRFADEGFKWRFTAYCGIFRLRQVRDVLEQRFGKDPTSFDQRSDGETCVFSIQITAAGRPLLDSFVLASCGWAIGRLTNPGPENPLWLEGFDAAFNDAALAFAERFAVLEDDEAGRELNSRPGVRVGRPIQRDELAEEMNRIAEELSIATVLAPAQIRLRARQVGENNFEIDSDDFLNSFFLNDLGRLIGEAESRNLGQALLTYLAPDEEIATQQKQDIRSSLEVLWNNTSPRLFPAGRWPSPSTQSLYFSQQFAVNSSVDQLRSGSPLFGVNGPPGTGKTTLLRDVIAAVLVERAQVLATLASPELAFRGSPGHWQTAGYPRSIHAWREDLLGFGVVVASSNNRAVENVTLEIPTISAIAEEFIQEIDHYADFGTRILNLESWGLIAARLGKSKHRKKFASNFWFEDSEAPKPKSRSNAGFLTYLNGVRAKPNAWKNAVADFQKAMEREQAIRNDRISAWDVIESTARLAESAAKMRGDVAEAGQSTSQTKSELAHAEQALQISKLNLDAAIRNRVNHKQFKPEIVDIILTLGKAYFEWRKRDSLLSRKIDSEQLQHDVAKARVAEQNRQATMQMQQVDKMTADLAQQEAALSEQRRSLAEMSTKLGAAFPRAETWISNPEERELSSPWADEAWNRARTEVFVQALRLHRTFIECVPGKIKSNLFGAMDILNGKVSGGIPAETLQSAWATLFFVVPVISTTFASFDRMFAHCSRESLGWLLIDEAGQAVPQAAAGAIWRSKKVIVVGDPQQLEPIVTLPFTAQQALRSHFGISETWLPFGNSIQKLADRVSPLGTWLLSDGARKPMWVGSPLRVHRRCERTIFNISNRIAYNEQMVYDTKEIELSLPPSNWFHVASSEADGHWIAEEGIALDIVLSDLLKRGVKPADILLVSPFREVVLNLKEIGERFGITQAGTIHVSQGKESDIVVLVLGGNPRLPGAKEWASEKPNLLNVAVSRAKRRLFIIGDREEWSQYPYFFEAAAALKQENPRKSVGQSS